MTGPRVEVRSKVHWLQKLAAVFFVLFCFELGVFLLLVPWTALWDRNYLSSLTPQWYGVWTSNFFRGAMSGIGIVNLYIAFLEMMTLRRHWLE